MQQLQEAIESILAPIVDFLTGYGLLQAALVVLATLALVTIVRLIRGLFNRLAQWVISTPRVGAIRVRGQDVVDGEVVSELAASAVRIFGWAIVILLVYVYLGAIFDLFPITDRLSDRVFSSLRDAARGVGESVVGYLPDLATLLLIVALGLGAIRATKSVFDGIETKRIRIRGFYPDWARPTFNIVRILIGALTAVVAFPYLPASDSPAFQGVSIFLGVLFSLGSTGAVTNAVSGVLLTYMRVFQLGDRVRIADAEGRITQRTMFVTRLLTPKNVEVSIPNSMVLNNHIINFSTVGKRKGVALHTTVTIGYDVPWRQVRELLLKAAADTEVVEKSPEPFVLQTALDDFYVHYELNAYTKAPENTPAIYSALHASIIDTFNEAGVEIASPHLRQLRDGNDALLPEDYLPKDFRPGGFRLFPGD